MDGQASAVIGFQLAGFASAVRADDGPTDLLKKNNNKSLHRSTHIHLNWKLSSQNVSEKAASAH